MDAAHFAALLDVARARGVSKFAITGVCDVTFGVVEAPRVAAPPLPRPDDLTEAARLDGAVTEPMDPATSRIEQLRQAERAMFPEDSGEV